MSKILGLDYGTKLIGVAITDETQKLVFPRGVIKNTEQNKALVALNKLICDEKVEGVVIGSPLYMEGNRSEFSGEVEAFATELHIISGKNIFWVDERLTTEQVARERKMMGIYGREKKQFKDELAACIILNIYLEKQI